MVKPSFKERHREMQELVRELKQLRDHNLQFKPGDQQDKLLLFSEGLVCLLAMERFLRIVLRGEATDRDTLTNLLQKATSKGRNLLTLPFANQQDGIRRIAAVRNTIMHGNYEQAASQAGRESVPDYFKTQFASEIEHLFKILCHMMDQIDARTGNPVTASEEPDST